MTDINGPVNNNLPTFPLLTKREYFAAVALQGIMTNNSPEVLKLEPEIKAELAILVADWIVHKLDRK
jgi:hypothetical protein